MQSYLEFIKQKEANKNNQVQFNEAFQRKDAEKAIDLISKLLKKHIDNLVPVKPLESTTVDGKACTSKYFLVNPNDDKKSMMFTMNWLVSGKSAEVYSIEFYKDMNLFWGGKGKSSLSIYTMGSSIVHFLPVIWTVVNDRKFNLKDEDIENISKKIWDKSANESATFDFYVGGLKYTVLENLSSDVIEDTFMLNVNEAGEDDEVKAYRAQKKMERDNADRKRRATGKEEDRLEFKRLHAEYDDIVHAIKAGAKTMADLKFAIKNNITCIEQVDDTIKKAEEELEAEKEDPENVFKQMQRYVKMVIKGLQPSVILCGAPGVGKTYRVMQQLKAAGYTRGQNLWVIKGKCSPRNLYKDLYNYQDKGNIIVIDDADGLVGPKAPEDVINILKAALDSTEDDDGRQVSYGVSGKIMNDDDTEIPKTFGYRGGVIVITNYNAGQLDTALRGRSFVQDIHFTTEDILNIVKGLMPAISPQMFSMKSKIKAFDYLTELYEKGQSMEISIRTFTLCCKIYETAADDEDFTDDEARKMIAHQMKMQALRGGKKY